MPVLTEKARDVGNLIINEYDPQYTRESVNVTNGTGAAWNLALGTPMAAAVPLLEAAIATADGILLKECVVAAGETVKLPILKRGPATLNGDFLPLTDRAGTTYTQATLRTRIGLLSPTVVVRDEPNIQGTQAT